MRRYETVDAFIADSGKWREVLVRLRGLVGRTELEETVKWGGPCYTLDCKLVLGLGAFKSYVGIWFHQGALLTDPSKVLVNAQEGVTKALRQWRFQPMEDIDDVLVEQYVREAIDNQRRGMVIKPDRDRPIVMPSVLAEALLANDEARAGFARLGKGKQREYVEYIEEVKREETRQKRLEKILPLLAAGTGLNDGYR